MGLTVATIAFSFTLHGEAGNFLKDFFDKLSSAPELPDAAFQEGFSIIAPRISTAPKDLVATALPTGIQILTDGNARQRGAVIVLLFEVARRRDGLPLLKLYLPQILACLRDPTPGIFGFANYILLNLFPPPTDAVVPYLISFIGDDNLGENVRAGAIGTLVWYAANDATAISAITGFMKIRHSKQVRIAIVHDTGLMLANSQQYSPGLVEFIIDSVRNDPEIRLESIEALGRCGWKSLPAANPVLTEIADNEHESIPVREAAKRALDEIVHSPTN